MIISLGYYLQGHIEYSLYVIYGLLSVRKQKEAIELTTNVSIIWNYRLGNAHSGSVENLRKFGAVLGLDRFVKTEKEFCEA